ncbi:flagellar hook-basal body protein [Marinicrinis lubricantis]|uniref:Flagellar hook-basal body protein n=1 Tax=Marinicrinis lubricantis TaxID=2086470 RepID=A0ABW1IKC6_9BACL
MIRGLYTAASGMMTQQRKHDTITNNIANVQTPGYKEQNAVSRSFPEVLIHLLRDNAQPGQSSIGRMHNGVYVEEIINQFMQGDLEETGNATDFAIVSNITTVDGEQYAFDENGQAVTADGELVIQPQAFFTVLNEAGEERYTRNGKFVLGSGGELMTADGYQVAGANGEPIVLQNAAGIGLSMDQIKLGAGGVLMADQDPLDGSTEQLQPIIDANGEPARLFISQINNPHMLVREGNGVYALSGADENPPQEVQDFTQVQVLQGYMERSNVDSAQAMVDMMAAVRAYEANQKVIQYMDSSLGKAVNDVGRI